MNGLRVVRRVLRDRQLRRVELGLAVFGICEIGTWLAITIFAFERGGVAEAGVVSFVQLAPAAVLAPLVAFVADRLPCDRVLAVGFAVQSVAYALTALAMLTGAHFVLVYAAATSAAVMATATRPSVGAVVPSLVSAPADLTAVNVASSFAEGIGLFGGPAIAGLMLTSRSPGSVFAAAACSMAVATVLTARLELVGQRAFDDADDPPSSTTSELLAGLSLIRRDRNIRLLMILLTASFMVIGALDIAFVAVAVELLGRPEASAGLFSAAAGLGSLLGAAGSLKLVGRTRLTIPLAWGVTVAGASLAGIAAGGPVALATLLFAAGGVGYSIADISGRTMLQGLAPDDVLARVFGMLEALAMASLGLGSLVFSGLAVAFGVRGALVTLGLALPVLVAVRLRRLMQIDALRPEVDPALLGLVRGVDIFAPLPPYTVEQLLVNFDTRRHDTGVELIREGDRGDEFFLVTAGSVHVHRNGNPVRDLGPGEYFGEIALLHDVPRTATVSSGPGGVEVRVLERDVFMSALTGHPRSLSRTEATASRRLDEHDDR